MRALNIIIGCEFSAIVRDAFRALGHNAISCDLRETDGDPKYHIKGDVRERLNDGWDMGVFFPDCTYMTIAGAAYYNDPGRSEKRRAAEDFFLELLNAPIEKIALENPIPFKSCQERIGKYDQYVNPFDFGTPERKRVCLWLKNLPLLKPTNPVPAPIKKTYIRKTGPKAGQPYHTYYHQGKSAKERARFWPCIAAAMAQQWSEA